VGDLGTALVGEAVVVHEIRLGDHDDGPKIGIGVEFFGVAHRQIGSLRKDRVGAGVRPVTCKHVTLLIRHQRQDVRVLQRLDLRLVG
jgi:hypothetical protein